MLGVTRGKEWTRRESTEERSGHAHRESTEERSGHAHRESRRIQHFHQPTRPVGKRNNKLILTSVIS